MMFLFKLTEFEDKILHGIVTSGLLCFYITAVLLLVRTIVTLLKGIFSAFK